MEENGTEKFLQDLYSKYNIQLDPEKQKQVLDHFSRDFDGSLSVFYKKYSPDKLKDLTPERISQIKSRYGILSPTPEPAMEEQQVAPEGFFQNLKNGLSNLPESVANSFWLGMNQVTRLGKTASDFLYDITGNETGKALNFVNVDLGIAPQMLEKIQVNNEALAPTKGIIESIEGGDVGAAAAGVVNVSLDFARSIASGYATLGMLPIMEQTESMYVDRLEQKAKEVGKNPIDLIIANEDDEFEPLLLGALAGLAERIGLKGFDDFINAMPKDIKSKAIKLLWTGTKEGGTEYLQGGLETLNSARGQGQTWEGALQSTADFFTSREGAETFVGGFLGATTLGAVGSYAKGRLERRAKEESGLDNDENNEDSLKPITTGGYGSTESINVSNYYKKLKEDRNKEIQDVNSLYDKIKPNSIINDPEYISWKSKKDNALNEVNKKYDNILTQLNDLSSAPKELLESMRAANTVVAQEVAPVSPELEAEIDGIINEHYGNKKEEEAAAQEVKAENPELTPEVEKSETKKVQEKEAKNVKAQEEKAKEIQKNIRDKSSLRSAISLFLGLNPTSKADLATASSMSEFIDAIVGSRAKREGITKEEWYRTRFAVAKVPESKVAEQGDRNAFSNILEDGRLLITALGKANQVDFLREFGKVIYNDLNDNEFSAFLEVFGIDLKDGILEEQAANKFSAAFESYLESGKVDVEAFNSKNTPFLKTAFEKIRSWISDIKQNLFRLENEEASVYISPQVKRFFDNVLSGKVEDVKTGPEGVAQNNVQPDTAATKPSVEAGKGVKRAKAGSTNKSTANVDEVIDMTESQEVVDETGSKVETKQEVKQLDEPKTKKGDGEGVKQTSPSDKKDRKDSGRTKETPKEPSEKQRAQSAKRLSDDLRRADLNKINRTSKGTINSEQARSLQSLYDRIHKMSVADLELLSKEDADIIVDKFEQLKELLDQDAADRARLSEIKEKNDKIKSEAVKAGITKTQVDDFIRENPNAEIISFADGIIDYIDTKTGEIESYIPKEGKKYTKKEADKVKKKIADNKVKQAEKELEAKTKTEEEKNNKKVREKQDKIAGQAFEYMTRSDSDKYSISNLVRLIKRLSQLNLLGKEWEGINEIAGMPMSTFKAEVRAYIESFLEQRNNSGSITTAVKQFMKDHVDSFMKAITGLDMSEKQLESIKAKIRATSDEILDRSEAREVSKLKKEAKAKEKAEKVEEKIYNDNSSFDTIGIAKGSRIYNIATTILKGFGLFGNVKTAIIDISSTNEDDVKDYLTKLLIYLGHEPDSASGKADHILSRMMMKPAGYLDLSGDLSKNGKAVNLILLNKSSSDTERTGYDLEHIFLHELGHVIEKNVLKNASEEVKDQIQEAFKKWSKEKATKSGKERFLSVLSPLTGYLNIQNIEDFEGDKKKSDPEIKFDRLLSPYYSSFSEFFAEQFAYWAETKETPRTALQKFFKGIVDIIKRVVDIYNFKFNESLEVQEFLDDHFKYLKDQGRAQAVYASNVIKDNSVKTAKDLVDNKRILSDFNKSLESTMSNRPSVPAGATKEEIQFILQSRKEAIMSMKDKIASLQRKVDSITDKIKEQYRSYAALSGTRLTSDEYVSLVEKEAEEIMNDNLAKAVARRANNEGKEEKDKLKPQGFALGSARHTFNQSVAKAINGKFTTRAQFDAIINSINAKLKAAGKNELKKADIKDIYTMTNVGKINNIKSQLHRSILKRGTEGKKNVYRSLSAPLSERLIAQQEIETILMKYVVNWKTLPVGRSAVTKKLKRDPNLDPKDFVRISELEAIGLENATPEEMDAFVNDGHLRKIIYNEASKIETKKAEGRSRRNFDVGRAFLIDVKGFKEQPDGSFVGKIKGKTYKLRVHKMNEAYSVGDTVEHLGNVYRVVKDVPANTPFKKANFERIVSLNEHRSKAELDKMDSILSRVKRFLRDAFLSSHGLESLVNKLAEKSEAVQMEGEMNKLLGEKGFREGAVKSARRFAEIEREIDRIGMKVFGLKDRKQVQKKLFEARTKAINLKYQDNNGNTVTKPFYLTELMDIYAAMLQPSLDARFESMKNNGLPADDTRFWNDSKRQAILSALPKENKAFVEGVIQDVMPTLYRDLNATFSELNGYDLINIPNYFPLTYDVRKVAGTEMDVEMNSIADFITSVSNSNLKSRSQGGNILPGDFVRKMYSYSSRALHYANYAVPMKKATSLFEMSSHYGGYFSTVQGKRIMDHIHWNLRNIAANSAAQYNSNMMLDAFRNMSIAGAFMANITMIPKQFSSFLAYAWKMPTGQWVKYYLTASPAKRIRDLKDIWNMQFIQDRLKQGGRTNLDTMKLMIDNLSDEINKSGARKNWERIHAKINDLLFAPTKWGDVAAILGGGPPYLDYLRTEAKQKYPSDPSKQKEYIEIKFSEQTSRTQQSRDMLDSSKWNTSSSAHSLFVTFMSTPMLYGRILNNGMIDLKRGIENRNRKQVKQGIKDILLFGLVLPYSFYAASNADLGYLSDIWDDEEDEEKVGPVRQTLAMFAISFFQHVPGLYPLLTSVVDEVSLGRDFGTSFAPTLNILEKGKDSSIRMFERAMSDGDIDFTDESVQKDISNIGRVFGLNAQTAMNIYDAWDNFEESWEENPFLLMGYSRFALGLDEK